MDEARLIEKLRAIEALFAGATTLGERIAAAEAKKRIEARLREFEKIDPPTEYRFTVADEWSRRLFVALLNRYGLKSYRYRGQRYTTLMCRVSKSFVDETLWPEYLQIAETLRTYLDEVTTRVVGEVIHAGSTDTVEIEEPRRLAGR